jgi:hypothetical protein
MLKGKGGAELYSKTGPSRGSDLSPEPSTVRSHAVTLSFLESRGLIATVECRGIEGKGYTPSLGLGCWFPIRRRFPESLHFVFLSPHD